jgi:hypothetical protein
MEQLFMRLTQFRLQFLGPLVCVVILFTEKSTRGFTQVRYRFSVFGTLLSVRLEQGGLFLTKKVRHELLGRWTSLEGFAYRNLVVVDYRLPDGWQFRMSGAIWKSRTCGNGDLNVTAQAFEYSPPIANVTIRELVWHQNWPRSLSQGGVREQANGHHE